MIRHPRSARRLIIVVVVLFVLTCSAVFVPDFGGLLCFMVGCLFVIGLLFYIWRMSTWYAETNGTELGPLSTAELANLYESGQATPATPVRNLSDTHWYTGTVIVRPPDRAWDGFRWGCLGAIAGFLAGYFIFGTVIGVRIPMDMLGEVLFSSADPTSAALLLFQGKIIPGIDDLRRGLETARVGILVSTFVVAICAGIAGAALATRTIRIEKGSRLR